MKFCSVRVPTKAYTGLKHDHHSARDHFVNVPSQWEMALHCNIVSHWLDAYTKWSLYAYADILTPSGAKPGAKPGAKWPTLTILNVHPICAFSCKCLTHLPIVLHICIYAVNRVSIGSDSGLSPIRRQAIITGSLSIGPLGTNFTEILMKIQNFSLTKMHLKISSAKWRPYCPGWDECTFCIWGRVLYSDLDLSLT